jgi:hypothetical protein
VSPLQEFAVMGGMVHTAFTKRPHHGDVTLCPFWANGVTPIWSQHFFNHMLFCDVLNLFLGL